MLAGETGRRLSMDRSSLKARRLERTGYWPAAACLCAACAYTTGIDNIKNCSTTSDCPGGKVCQYGDCVCPSGTIDCGLDGCLTPFTPSNLSAAVAFSGTGDLI